MTPNVPKQMNAKNDKIDRESHKLLVHDDCSNGISCERNNVVKMDKNRLLTPMPTLDDIKSGFRPILMDIALLTILVTKRNTPKSTKASLLITDPSLELIEGNTLIAYNTTT